jgi:hydroxymethylpyrimidine kinase/phosphomethylpyrimidine kinase
MPKEGPMTPTVLTIAGSDSGGGAGIQADLKTVSALGCYGASAITAVTAQNTRGVAAVHPVPPDLIRAQIDAVLDDIQVHAIKIGMVGSAAGIAAVAASLRDCPIPIVLDPVMVAKSGDVLMPATPSAP